MRASRGFGSFVRGIVVAISAVSVLGPDVPADGAAADPAFFSYPFGGDISRIAAGPDGTIYVAGWTTTPDLPASTSTPSRSRGSPWRPTATQSSSARRDPTTFPARPRRFDDRRRATRLPRCRTTRSGNVPGRARRVRP